MADKQRKAKHSVEEIDEDYKDVKKGKKKKKKSKFRRIFVRILIIFLMIIAVLLGAVVGFGYNMLSQLDYDTTLDKNDIEKNEGIQSTGYLNIVLFGVDSRDQKDSYNNAALSDVIMIVSINQDTKKIKIASVYRDTYLQNAKTKSFDKITHAFRGRTKPFNEHVKY